MRQYGDIAFSSNGSTLYGVNFPGDEGSRLYTINPATGAEVSSVPITGPIASAGGNNGAAINALTARADGTLLAGSFWTRQIFVIDPNTGVSSVFPASFPEGVISAGDFLTLDDGDILGFGNPEGAEGAPPSSVFRIHPDNTVVQIGTMPQIFGAALSGGNAYGFGSAGAIYRITSLPISPSTSPLAVTSVASPGAFYFGATAAQDAGQCPQPAYTVAKSATTDGPVLEGDIVTYTLSVTNTGTVVSNADFSDDLSEVLDNAKIVPGSLTASTGKAEFQGNSLHYTAVLAGGENATISYQVRVNAPATDDEILANTVTATAAGGSCAPTKSCTVTIPVDRITRGLTVAKKATEGAFTAPGQILHYTYTVTNTGNVAVSSLTVTDNGPGSPQVICPTTTLAPGASTNCTATHTTTAADVQSGKVVNTALGGGTTQGGVPVFGSSNTVTVPYAGLKVLKSAQEPSFSGAGQTLHYNYAVTNTGNVAVSSLTVTDNGPGSPQVICPTTTLAPGASTNCTATHTTTAADVQSGKVVNTALGGGTTQGGVPVFGSSNTVTVPYAGLKVLKSAQEPSFSGAGQTLHYNYAVTNTGQTPLSDIAVQDDGPGRPEVTCPAEDLAPGMATICTATYTTTEADVVAGKVTNVAQATGSAPGGAQVAANSNTVTVPARGIEPKLQISKNVEETAFSAAGQLLHYTFTVTNVGTVSVSKISVTDVGPGNPKVSCPVAKLAPGESTTCTAKYTTTSADVRAKKITDKATVTGSGPSGQLASATSNTVTIVSCAPCQDVDHGGCKGDRPQGKPHRPGKGARGDGPRSKQAG
ncbi:DUF7507 domain-containing protein [Streptomyces vinaceus]|uniref:DUF7507 domain-containing protein n=1 Tax=Streptomyces vinaceus TaxID=1960 RepID=UPI003828BEBB